jgi:hypothetical protein
MVFIALIFLGTIIACVVPGLPTASAPAPTPTVDSAQVEEMVAQTVSAAIAETEQSIPSPTPMIIDATSTPEVAFTPTPDSVDSISVSTMTNTPAPAVVSTATQANNPSQSDLAKQTDGSTLFTDARTGYTVKLPAGWLAVRVNGPEYQSALSSADASNPNIQQSLLSIKEENPNAFRLLALDTQANDIQSDFVSEARFVLDEKKTISLATDADLQAIARDIPASATAFRFEVTSVKIVTLASGMQIGVIEAKSSFANQAGTDVPIYQKQVFFKSKAGTQKIVFTTVDSLKGTLLPVFDGMLETIKSS